MRATRARFPKMLARRARVSRTHNQNQHKSLVLYMHATRARFQKARKIGKVKFPCSCGSPSWISKLWGPQSRTAIRGQAEWQEQFGSQGCIRNLVLALACSRERMSPTSKSKRQSQSRKRKVKTYQKHACRQSQSSNIGDARAS